MAKYAIFWTDEMCGVQGVYDSLNEAKAAFKKVKATVGRCKEWSNCKDNIDIVETDKKLTFSKMHHTLTYTIKKQ